MAQEKQQEQSEKRTITIELTWRAVGYLGAMFLIIFSMGLQTYPLLSYPAIWAFLILGIGILLLAISAPFIRKK